MTSRLETQAGKALSFLGFQSIKNKLVALAVAATLVPTLSTAIVSYVQNKRSLTEKIEGELRSAGSHTARELDLWIRQQIYDIGIFAGSFEVTENTAALQDPTEGASDVARERIQAYWSALEENYSDYAELLVVDSGGDVLASNEVEREGGPPGLEQVAGQPAGHLGSPEWDSRLGSTLALLSHPVRTPDGVIQLGHLVARLDFRAVDGLLQSNTLGTSGQVYLVTEDGQVFASTRREDTSPPARLNSGTLDLLSENLAETAEYDDLAGATVLGTMHSIPNVSWRVVAEVDRSEAFAPVARLRNITLLIVVGLTLVMGTIAYLLSQIVVKPLSRLSEGAADVAAGDFSVDLPVTGGGEVGYLTEVFNDMVHRLREGRHALDAAHEELVERNEELARLSVTDELTQLTNRRRALEVLEEEVERVRRGDQSMSLLMLDVDHFKKYNDKFGHLEGDAVLRGVAKALRQATRGIDTVGRYGGEEFVIILPECDVEGALEAGTRILTRLARDEYQDGPVTMSIGVAICPDHELDGEALIAVADAALYEAKERGRNRVVLAEGVELPEGSKYASEMGPSNVAMQARSKRKKKAGAES